MKVHGVSHGTYAITFPTSHPDGIHSKVILQQVFLLELVTEIRIGSFPIHSICYQRCTSNHQFQSRYSCIVCWRLLHFLQYRIDLWTEVCVPGFLAEASELFLLLSVNTRLEGGFTLVLHSEGMTLTQEINLSLNLVVSKFITNLVQLFLKTDGTCIVLGRSLTSLPTGIYHSCHLTSKITRNYSFSSRHSLYSLTDSSCRWHCKS